MIHPEKNRINNLNAVKKKYDLFNYTMKIQYIFYSVLLLGFQRGKSLSEKWSRYFQRKNSNLIRVFKNLSEPHRGQDVFEFFSASDVQIREKERSQRNVDRVQRIENVQRDLEIFRVVRNNHLDDGRNSL